jgi:hypothetical protein
VLLCLVAKIRLVFVMFTFHMPIILKKLLTLILLRIVSYNFEIIIILCEFFNFHISWMIFFNLKKMKIII